MRTYGVIMAGGGGTRFWPLSRKQTPKQLLNLSGNGIMVNEAIERLARVAAYKDIFIVTNALQKAAMLDVVDKRILTASHTFRVIGAQHICVYRICRYRNFKKIRRRYNGNYAV